jgi:hypothetical protein
MKLKISIIIFFNVALLFAQSDENKIYLLDPNGFERIGGYKKIIYILNKKDNNPKFNHDSFKFTVPNRSGYDKLLRFNDIRKKISLDTINFTTKKKLFSEMENYEIHEYFSYLFRNGKSLFIIIKKHENYYHFPVQYNGTEKNLEILNHGF